MIVCAIYFRQERGSSASGAGWVAWQFLAGPGQMQSFCRSLDAGLPVAQVQAQAKRQGYRMSPLIDDHGFLYDSSSFGRVTCVVQFGPDGLQSSAYGEND